MTFTCNTLTRCAGQEHWTFNVTSGAQTRNLVTTENEMRVRLDVDVDTKEINGMREIVLRRLRSAILEAGATTFAQARTAVEAKTFQA